MKNNSTSKQTRDRKREWETVEKVYVVWGGGGGDDGTKWARGKCAA